MKFLAFIVVQNDYFDENFDETKNCKQEKYFSKLMKEKENGIRIRCAEVNGKGSDVDNWNQCKMALNKKLINVCAKSCPYCTAKRRVLEVRTTKLVCL